MSNSYQENEKGNLKKYAYEDYDIPNINIIRENMKYEMEDKKNNSHSLVENMVDVDFFEEDKEMNSNSAINTKKSEKNTKIKIV